MEKALAIMREVERILGTSEVYLVGGCVRDLVMGNEPKDYDFTTPMLPDDIEAAVQKAGRHAYGIGKKFGTIGFKVHDGSVGERGEEGPMKFEYVEVTTFRSEVYTSKSRKPEVEFVTSLDEDLARRDFTMNAMVLKSDGKIYDPYGGRIHIHSKQIITVGLDKDRITEDPLRILRAARFAARYGFEIDPNFIGKARQLADRIFDVSVERWVQELDKLITSQYAYEGMEALHATGVLPRILPELYCVDDDRDIPTIPFDCCGERKHWPEEDAAWKFLLNCVHTPVQIKDVKKTKRFIQTGICARFKFSNDRTKIILDK